MKNEIIYKAEDFSKIFRETTLSSFSYLIDEYNFTKINFSQTQINKGRGKVFSLIYIFESGIWEVKFTFDNFTGEYETYLKSKTRLKDFDYINFAFLSEFDGNQYKFCHIHDPARLKIHIKEIAGKMRSDFSNLFTHKNFPLREFRNFLMEKNKA